MAPMSSSRHQEGPLSNWPCRRMLQAVGHSLYTSLISVCPLALLCTCFNILTCYLHFGLTNKNQHPVLMLCYFFPPQAEDQMYHCLIFVASNEFDFCPGGGQLADYVVLIFMTVGLREIRSWCKLLSDTFIQCFFAFRFLTVQLLAAASNGTFIWQTMSICNSRYCLLIIVKVGNNFIFIFLASSFFFSHFTSKLSIFVKHYLSTTICFFLLWGNVKFVRSCISTVYALCGATARLAVNR